ncbi:MAG TPA: ComEC/Rec2 family competence protein [Bryobacteraceae bacterium]|nr:ComEC/Rec2 family competence protein [Bryobacteraceae bacterium]
MIAAFFLLGLASLWRGSRVVAGACCLLGLFFAGCLTEMAHRPGPPPELDAGSREIVILSGCVVQPPALAGDRARFVLELEPGARVQVTLYGKEDAPLPALAYGQRVEIEARVRRPRNFANPGAFDYAGYLARQQIFWTASAPADAPVRVLAGSCGSAFQKAIVGLRTAALERLARLYAGNAYETGMMQAILIGESFQLERVWTEHFRSTGTFHALVISGTHVAVLAAFLMFLLRLCFVPRGAAMTITVLAAWLYALVAGWQAPCVRSAAGFTLFLAGGYFYRERRIMNLLAAVALGFLLLDPAQMFEASFQLSFLAVGFIGAFAAPWLERTWAPLERGLADLADTGRDLHLEPRVAQFRVEMRLLAETVRLWTRLPERACLVLMAAPARALFYLFGLLLVSAVVQVGLALPMVVYFHRVGFSGLSANALVVPLMEFVVPLGFVAVFTGWGWAAHGAAWLLDLSRRAVDWHARLEPNWRIPTPPLWLGVALAAALMAAALADRAGKRWRAASVGAVVALLALLVWHPFAPQVVPRQLEMTAIDVGQGDSLLVAFPGGKLMLVDGGGIPVFGRQRKAQIDIGEDVVSPYLWQRSIRTLDVVVCTHAHEDHVGGLPALLANFRVRELWTGALPDGPQTRPLREAAARLGTRLVAMHRGQNLEFSGARVRVLAPAPDYVPGPAPRNNDSLALAISYGRNSFLLLGDVERQVEAEMAADNLLSRTDVLKVPHHGSKTSSSEVLLDAAQPAFALISAGFENPYGHPHPDVLARYRAHRICLFRTDLDGLVSFRSDGRRIQVETNTGSGPDLRLLSAF